MIILQNITETDKMLRTHSISSKLISGFSDPYCADYSPCQPDIIPAGSCEAAKISEDYWLLGQSFIFTP